MHAQKIFPEGFYWGASTSAFQIEGNIYNTDWAKAAQEGRVPKAGRGIDHYNRYESDFDLAKDLGHNAHRLSIEWARIEPEEGRFDRKEIEHYRKVLRALRARNIEPFITLWHFTSPLWFSEKGGFEQRDAPDKFARYCAYVVQELSDLCTHFSTMNEPNVYGSNGWLRGSWPPFKRFSLTDMVAITNSGRSYESKADRSIGHLFRYLRVMRHLARAHNAAYTKIKSEAPNVKVGVVKHVIYFHANKNPFNILKAWVSNYSWTHIFMKRVHRFCDEVGLNYYFHKKFGDRATYEKTDMDWDIYPEGIYGALLLLSRYKKPLFVTEAGIADEKDVYRAHYITQQVEATWRAIQDGIDVRGHMYWSLLDNYEWALGYDKRFGLIAVNYDTLERTVRPSAYVYKKICENNGIV